MMVWQESDSPPPESQDAPPRVTMRIPGRWSGPQEFVEALPRGFEVEDGTLHLPDGSHVEINVLPADDEFASIFAEGCERRPSDDDIDTIENFTVNVCLSGPCGSPDAALRMMQAAACVIHAGGAGVFIDNSGKAHGTDDWLALVNDPDNADGGDWGGVYWAFVATARSETELWTVGMHVLGHRDAVITRSGDDEFDYFVLHNFLGYSYRSGETIVDGDLIGDENAPRFCVRMEPFDRLPPGTVMSNPYGQWRLEPVDANADEPEPKMRNDE